MAAILVALVLFLSVAAPLRAGEPVSVSSRDVVAELLARGSLKPSDLAREGANVNVPFALPHLSRTLADPLRLPRFGATLARAAERFKGEPANLFGALAVTTRFPSVALASGANLPEEDDLALALEVLRRPDDAPFPWSGSFGTVKRVAETPSPSELSRREAESLPEGLRRPLARLLFALADADAWVSLAWRRVPRVVAQRASSQRGVAAEIADGGVFFPDIEDAARDLDGEAIAYAALKSLAGTERAARELEAVVARAPGSFRTLSWSVETPRGRVIVRGTGDDVETFDAASRVLLLLDLGGNDSYEGVVAAARLGAQRVSVLLDLSGNDRYEAKGDVPSQGAGLGGVGLLFDARGDDRYAASERAQGYGQLGVGMLVDLEGNDRYTLGESGQGAALFGAGFLLDARGDDVYAIRHDGQGFGGPGGTGVLVDLGGNDRYTAERDPKVASRADPRADGKASTSNAQGVGLGRRGDFSDGRSWAGGLGVLLDLEGNDVYEGGTWCQGAGFFYGTGILYDGAGNDTYDAVWYAQGAGAHHALGLLLDARGDDAYTLSGTGGAGLGFGWDGAVGVFADLAGNDRYRANRLALGAAMRRGFGLFVDVSGNDVYALDSLEGLGFVDDGEEGTSPRPLERERISPPDVALFLDLEGQDVYPKGRGGEGKTWGSFEEPARPGVFGAGVDSAKGGRPDFLELGRPPR